jgi:hypothetical protein
VLPIDNATLELAYLRVSSFPLQGPRNVHSERTNKTGSNTEGYRQSGICCGPTCLDETVGLQRCDILQVLAFQGFYTEVRSKIAG